MARWLASIAPAAAQKKSSTGLESPREVKCDALRPPFEFRKNAARTVPPGSALLQHDFRGLDYRRHRIADLQFHFVGASPGDHAFDHVLADADCHVSHDAIHLELNNLSFNTVSR